MKIKEECEVCGKTAKLSVDDKDGYIPFCSEKCAIKYIKKNLQDFLSYME